MIRPLPADDKSGILDPSIPKRMNGGNQFSKWRFTFFPWLGIPAGSGRSSIQESGTGESGDSSRGRNPSATISMVLVSQVQFLATLALVDSTGVEGSWLLEFVESLRGEKIVSSSYFSRHA